MKSKKQKTPALPNWLASKFIDEMYLEEFFGDLEEIYEDRIQCIGKFNARFMYWFDVFHLLFGFTSLKLFKTQNNNTIMLRNMFKIAFRNAMRQKQFTILNLLGLTLGISASLIIGIYVHHEMNFDDFHVKKSRIYRVNQPNIWGDWADISSATGPNVATALKEDIPEFEEVTRLLSFGAQIVNLKKANGNSIPFKENNYTIVENNFFNVFTFEFLEGNPETAMIQPESMVLTKETSERYFGFKDALGRTVEVKEWDGSWKTFTITGVINDVPSNSHLDFDMLVSMNSYKFNMDRDGWKWIWTAFSTYGLVYEGTDIDVLREKIQAVPPKWAPPTTERIFNQTFEEFTAGNQWRLYLQPLDELYLSATPNTHVFGPTGNPQVVKIFIAIGGLILVLSCINFMNLSTARSSNRAKEVGVRKVLGSSRSGLILQFIFESILFVSVSTLSALIVINLCFDKFNQIAGRDLELYPYLSNPGFLLLLGFFVLVLGTLAGSYPAFYLSSFRPIEVLKGKLSQGVKGASIRNGLVIFQFTISIALIICAFFVQKQLGYSSSVDVGFSKNNILQIHNIEQFGFNTKTLQTELSANSSFSKVGKSYGVPPAIWSGDRYRAIGGVNPVVQLSNLRTEASYLDLLGLEFIAGSNFQSSRPTDKYGIILNETAVKLLGWGTVESFGKDSPIGKSVALASGDEDEFNVIGVVKDFNFNSLKQNITPLLILSYENDKVWDYGGGLSFISLRLKEGIINSSTDLERILGETEAVLASIDPSIPFEYSFMDQAFENTFRTEKRLGQVLGIFTFIAIIIACLGLFGLAAFSMEQRMKELGIRKVLGAKVSELLILFSSEFTKLILVSIILASILSYLLVDRWLADFAYRTPIEMWVFVIAAISVIGIALLTIGHQSLKAANRNPIEALKDE